MAKWGEGDPRWIVEERADAKNVNNWHWSEKNATQWSKDVLHSLIGALTIENDQIHCEITSLSKCEGEAVANNRKAKLIFFYEWHIEAQWSGCLKNHENKTNFTGTIEIPNLSEENEVDEVDVSVTCSSNSDDARRVKEFLRCDGATVIRGKISEYLRRLKEEYGRDLILPTVDTTKESKTVDVGLANAAALMRNPMPNSVTAIRAGKQDVTSQDLELVEEFFCTPSDLYKLLVTKELTQAFTRDAAIIEANVGGGYSIFGGNITGIFISLTPNEFIEMHWRKREWPENHYSLLKLNISAFEGGTRLTLQQSGVPGYDVDNTRGGWQSQFFGSLKQTYGYGGKMFL